MKTAAAGLSLTGSRAFSDELTPTAKEHIASYTNYYEMSTGKEESARIGSNLTLKPWEISVEGAFDKTGIFDLNDVLSGLTPHSRIYRFRCVEAWSMVVPWNGVQLSDLLQKFGVQSSAKYIAFETLVRPEEMPGIARGTLDWPYREGLRIDEAMHPLTLMATGLYDEPLLGQNGGPIRLVVPWKYGFKSIKSIVRITATESQPYATWNASNSGEYGFYANVNPEVSHPRWSQASERVLGAGLIGARRDTEMFNGYNEVASLYQGMDLTKFF